METKNETNGNNELISDDELKIELDDDALRQEAHRVARERAIESSITNLLTKQNNKR